MSRGIGGRAVLLYENDTELVYRYGAFNWNRQESMNPDYETDGQIVIRKEALPIIEFHNRSSKKANQRKGPVKRVAYPYTIDEMVQIHALIVQNSRYCWHVDAASQIDIMALRVVGKLLAQYAQSGQPPEKVFMVS